MAVIDPVAAFRAAAGSTVRCGLSWPRYTWARIEPSTATPSAPATWRAVLVSAEPEPARSRGTTDMTASVAGGITLPMPAPCTKKITPSTQIGVLVPSSR